MTPRSGKVAAHLTAGTAHWCPIIRLELWNGAGGDREKKVLREFERFIAELALTIDVWNDACDLARRGRAAGVSAPATDVLIAVCARHYGARLEHADNDLTSIVTTAKPPSSVASSRSRRSAIAKQRQ